MEEETKPHFEEMLESGENLPQTLNVKSFTEARMKEIAALTEAIEHPCRTGMIFQRLPKHMRRRAMGHNVKRMPRNLQKFLSISLEKCGVKDQPKPRPRRKYRRRPRNLLSEYNRRQRKCIWLETHIWHAKRFHMINKWGYKLANFPNDKCFRACYRASAQHCLLQDISYYNCIEIRGDIETLLTGLKLHTSPECGLTFSAKCLLDGSREGHVMFFKRNMYPKNAIGEVSFIWKPEITLSKMRTIWMWVHPAFCSEFISEIATTFQLEQMEKDAEQMDICEYSESMCKFKKSVEGIKLEIKNMPFNKTPKFFCESSGVTMYLLKDTLSRFRLIGPLSQAIITEAFQAANLNPNDNINNWYKEYCSGNEKSEDCFKLQGELWRKLQQAATPGQLPPLAVFSLNVIDPRLTMPCKRRKAVFESKEFQGEIIRNFGSNLVAESPLWSPEVRDMVAKEKMSSEELSIQRSTKIVPGLEMELVDLTKNSPSLPIIFIHQSGNTSNQRLGYGSGWDLIIPCGWGMPVWLGLVFRGARTGGLREAECLRREMGKLPFLPPDTNAGRLEDVTSETHLKEEYFRNPPAKRHNYIKLGITSPFQCSWNILVQEWSNSNHEVFYILRNKSKLNHLQKALKDFKNCDEVENLTSLFTDEEKAECLVPVEVIFKGKGSLNRFAHISCPHGTDLENLKKNAGFPGPIEPAHDDSTRKMRNEIRVNHKALLMKLRRKRVKQRRKSENNIKIDEHPTEDIVKLQKDKMEQLWLPPCREVKDANSRTTIGFVVNGTFSFTESCSSGQGYVHLAALLSLIDTLRKHLTETAIVLVRSTHSSQFRFAHVKIVT